jgi:hypothetical protein
MNFYLPLGPPEVYEEVHHRAIMMSRKLILSLEKEGCVERDGDWWHITKDGYKFVEDETALKAIKDM